MDEDKVVDFSYKLPVRVSWSFAVFFDVGKKGAVIFLEFGEIMVRCVGTVVEREVLWGAGLGEGIE